MRKQGSMQALVHACLGSWLAVLLGLLGSWVLGLLWLPWVPGLQGLLGYWVAIALLHAGGLQGLPNGSVIKTEHV